MAPEGSLSFLHVSATEVGLTFTLKVEAGDSSETLLTTQCYYPEDHNLNFYF
jgi:hypothetical protein